MNSLLSNRRGMVTALALAVLAILALAAVAVHLLTRQSYRELNRLDGFLRAAAVAEACHDRLLARIEARPWSERWFQSSFDTGDGSWNDGRYEFLLADGERPAEADLLVRARWEDTRIVVFYRLQADPYSLAPYRRVRTVFFSRESPATPLAISGLAELRARIDNQVALREYNRGWAEGREVEVLQAPGPDAIAAILGAPTGPPILGGLPSPGAEAPVLPPEAAGPPPAERPQTDVVQTPQPPAVPAAITTPVPAVPATPQPPVTQSNPLSLAAQEIIRLYRLVDQLDATLRGLTALAEAAAACPGLAAADLADIRDQTAQTTGADNAARQAVLDLARKLTGRMQEPEPTYEQQTEQIRETRVIKDQWSDAERASRGLRARVEQRVQAAGCTPPAGGGGLSNGP